VIPFPIVLPLRLSLWCIIHHCKKSDFYFMLCVPQWERRDEGANDGRSAQVPHTAVRRRTLVLHHRGPPLRAHDGALPRDHELPLPRGTPKLCIFLSLLCISLFCVSLCVCVALCVSLSLSLPTRVCVPFLLSLTPFVCSLVCVRMNLLTVWQGRYFYHNIQQYEGQELVILMKILVDEVLFHTHLAYIAPSLLRFYLIRSSSSLLLLHVLGLLN
jgi:hypothetical protein